jgi:NTE family protein
MSGGGKRSASFSYGALDGMREIPIQTRDGSRPLLREIDAITGVSGGSFTATYYGLYRDTTFSNYKTDFLYQDTESYIYGIYLLPWNWTWLVDPSVGTNDFMDRTYNRTLYHGATFADLQKLGRPVIAIGATDISNGAPFLFTQETLDLICSDLSQFPLSRAVAASNGFPGLFSPITLTNHASDCTRRTPGWLRRVTPAQRQDPLSRVGNASRDAERYLDDKRVRYVHLVDGGVSDNLALRAAGSSMQTLAQTEGGLDSGAYNQIRRILIISVDGQGGQDETVAQRRLVGGIFSLFRLVSGAQIDWYNFDTLITITDQANNLAAALAKARCARAAAIAGYACADVKAALVHVSLTEMPEGPRKEQLLAIRTGLTLRHEDVDALIGAGHDAIITSDPLRTFLDEYADRSSQRPGSRISEQPNGRSRAAGL